MRYSMSAKERHEVNDRFDKTKRNSGLQHAPPLGWLVGAQEKGLRADAFGQET